MGASPTYHLMDPVIAAEFPNLKPEEYGKESPESPHYNCIAFAAGVTNRWWWPRLPKGPRGPAPRYAWPLGAPTEPNVEAFVKAFETLGYSVCDNGDLEEGFEKIAIYDHLANAKEFHASRQLDNGWWISKFGPYKDLEHKTAEAIETATGYKVQRWMKRKRPE